MTINNSAVADTASAYCTETPYQVALATVPDKFGTRGQSMAHPPWCWILHRYIKLEFMLHTGPYDHIFARDVHTISPQLSALLASLTYWGTQLSYWERGPHHSGSA